MDEDGSNDMKRAAERDADRLREAERQRHTLLAQTVFLGSLALMFVLPIVGGAYLGRWIDAMFEEYSVRWTVSLIVLGVVVGTVNVFLFIRERP
ncbi:AtpZ/AtpI family protein [Emcibacter nanhaiensis]|uniref:AtpZ/AtpI family protein n=1 Tax=Emcibacter nanhaiensis TaxID=1505037 RepID=A0A501PIF8_9PROT|nr:AtpZ/AtpI family protein [Emcibacter nanhaiensis]TPD59838.1 AtpZ/AtpI family protein [Emcibacter nanhaiensis]